MTVRARCRSALWYSICAQHRTVRVRERIQHRSRSQGKNHSPIPENCCQRVRTSSQTTCHNFNVSLYYLYLSDSPSRPGWHSKHERSRIGRRTRNAHSRGTLLLSGSVFFVADFMKCLFQLNVVIKIWQNALGFNPSEINPDSRKHLNLSQSSFISFSTRNTSYLWWIRAYLSNSFVVRDSLFLFTTE